MKRHLLFSLICVLLATLTLVLPYSYYGVNAEDTPIGKDGYDYNLAWFQLLIYLVALLVSSIKRSLTTAIIGLVLCFPFFLYFILLSMDIKLDVTAEITFGEGYFYALAIAAVFWILHIINLVMEIRRRSLASQRIDSDLLD